MPALGRDDDVLGLLETHGLEPKIAFTTLDTVSALAMIQNDLGMSIMNELITKSWPGKVAILPLDPPQQLTLGVAVPSLPRAAPAVKAFLQFAVQALTQAIAVKKDLSWQNCQAGGGVAQGQPSSVTTSSPATQSTVRVLPGPPLRSSSGPPGLIRQLENRRRGRAP